MWETHTDRLKQMAPDKDMHVAEAEQSGKMVEQKSHPGCLDE